MSRQKRMDFVSITNNRLLTEDALCGSSKSYDMDLTEICKTIQDNLRTSSIESSESDIANFNSPPESLLNAILNSIPSDEHYCFVGTLSGASSMWCVCVENQNIISNSIFPRFNDSFPNEDGETIENLAEEIFNFSVAKKGVFKSMVNI